MPAPLKPIARETVVRARDDYVSGKKAAQIMAENDLTTHQLYTVLAGEGPAKGLPAITLRREILGERAKAPSRARTSLVERLWRAADRQVRDIEKRMRLDEQKPEERERDARVLATTVKTLRDLQALDAARAEEEPASGDEQRYDNLDHFRRELARKMDAALGSSETADPD